MQIQVYDFGFHFVFVWQKSGQSKSLAHVLVRRLLCRHSKKLIAAWALLALVTALSLTVGRIGPAQDPSHTLSSPLVFAFGFVIFQGLLSPLFAALTLLLTATLQIGFLSEALSNRVLGWLAPITYEIYLLHPLVSPSLACNASCCTQCSPLHVVPMCPALTSLL